jgi:hypothetical protein
MAHRYMRAQFPEWYENGAEPRRGNAQSAQQLNADDCGIYVNKNAAAFNVGNPYGEIIPTVSRAALASAWVNEAQLANPERVQYQSNIQQQDPMTQREFVEQMVLQEVTVNSLLDDMIAPDGDFTDEGISSSPILDMANTITSPISDVLYRRREETRDARSRSRSRGRTMNNRDNDKTARLVPSSQAVSRSPGARNAKRMPSSGGRGYDSHGLAPTWLKSGNTHEENLSQPNFENISKSPSHGNDPVRSQRAVTVGTSQSSALSPARSNVSVPSGLRSISEQPLTRPPAPGSALAAHQERASTLRRITRGQVRESERLLGEREAPKTKKGSKASRKK